jgi:preprotein translocase subunit SecG
MLTILSILIFLACCLLVLAVLIQNPKGGGLASGFQSGAQVMGVRRTADFLEKATWGLAVGVLLMCVLSTTMMMNGGEGTTEAETSTTKEQVERFHFRAEMHQHLLHTKAVVTEKIEMSGCHKP